MRFKIPEKKYTPYLSKRTKTRFLWFPKKIEEEVRWLEKATWEEIYTGYEWVASRWIDENENQRR